MALKRVFLNWDKSLLSSSALELFKQVKGNRFFDLSHLLVVVPTSHAINNMSYKLTEIANESGCAILPPKIVTPQFFFSYQMNQKVPLETQRILFFIEAIKLNESNLTSLFPNKRNKDNNLAWYLDKAERIIELANTLASIGLTIGEVLNNSDALKDDFDRFVELSLIEANYFELLKKAGLEDTNKVKTKNALNPKLPEGIAKVIFIAVSDPIPILTETIKILSSSIELEIWINAPIDLESTFDAFGRPEYDFWKEKDLNIPDFKNSVTLFDSPRELVTDFINLIAEKNPSDNKEINISDISLILPDSSLEIAVRNSFLKHEIKTYNPSGVNLDKTLPCILFNAILEFILKQDYNSFANLIRNADFLSCMKLKIKNLDYSSLFAMNDYMQNKYMPISFEDMLNAVELENKKTDKRIDRTALAFYSQSLSILKGLLVETEGKEQFTEFAFSKTIETYELIQSSILSELKENFSDSLKIIKDVINEVKESFGKNYKYNEKDIALLTTRRLQNTILYPVQEDGTLPLRGWLELQWEEKKPFTFIIGMNEGIVPSVTINDMFLPDSLKKKLNLPCNDSRSARDAYILCSVIENSQTKYHINFIVMKTDQQGEYLKPSKLLLQSSNQGNFYKKLNYLFRGESIVFKQEDMGTNDYPLKYSVPDKKLHENKLSVTDFKDYLECPFRFYLKKILKYEEEIDDIKTDLDNREFGSICHEILKSLGTKLKEKDGKELKSLLFKKLAYEKSKFSSSVPVEFSFYSLEQRLNKALEIMIEDAETSEWEIKDLEKDFTFILDSDKMEKWLGSPVKEKISFSIKGRIDRIDISKNNKTLRIIDYKTGSVSITPREEHYRLISARTNESIIKDYTSFEINGKEYRWLNLQLPLYVAIIQELSEYKGFRVDNCSYFVIPKSVTDTKIISWGEVLEQEIGAARKCAALIILNIAKGIFWPPSERAKYDNYEKILYDISFGKYIAFGRDK